MRFKKGMALAATFAMTLTAVCGCASNKKVSESEYSKTVGATYGKEKIYLDELFIYHRFAQKEMDDTFDAYKDWGFLAADVTREEFYGATLSGELTVLQTVKQSAVASLYQTRVLNDYAKENNITLSDDDVKKVEEEVKHFTTGDEAYLFEGTVVNEDLLRRFFTENAIANRVHEKLFEGYDPSVNEVDYRVARGSYFVISKDKYEDTDEAQRAKDVLAAVEAEYEKKDKKIEDVDFDKIAKDFSDKDETETPTTEAGETTGEGETTTAAAEGETTTAAAEGETTTAATAEEKHLVKVYSYKDTTIYIGGTDNKLAAAAKDLAVGTFAQTEDDNYIYILYVSDPTDKDATQSRIDSEIHSRKEKQFEKKYEELLKDAPKIEVKDSVYDKNLVYKEIPYPTTEAPSEEEPVTEETTQEVTTAEATTAEETTAEATTEEETTQEATAEEATTGEAATEEATSEEAATEDASTIAETEDVTTEEVPTEEAPSEAEEPTEATTVAEE
jgi:hypothetical protein